MKVVGFIEVNKRAYIKVIDTESEKEILPEIEKKVAKGTTIVTDGGNPFDGLKFIGYNHKTVRH